jgi:UDP-2,3-diacylglucosamine hydrolase
VRPILLISDLHLSAALPETAAVFERFIGSTAATAQALYILGDLFEYWVGDDELEQSATPFVAHICRLLHSLSERGIALYVMPGNRDFLLGPRFARAAGASMLPDPFILHAFGQRIVLAHGDALCTLDRTYQRFRRIARQPAVQRLFLQLPLRWRLTLARALRRRSSSNALHSTPANYADNPVQDVTRDAVMRLLDDNQAMTLIHGHTHRPAHHLEPERWVLPDWEFDHGPPRGGYLQLDEQGLHALSLT